MNAILTLGLMGVLSLQTFSLLSNSLKSSRTVASSISASNVPQDIRAFLSDPANCETTFGGVNPLSQPTYVTSLNDSLGNAIFQVGSMYGDNHLTITSISLGQFPYDPTVVPRALVDLTINLQKTGDILGPDRIFRKVPLMVSVNPSSGLVLSCHSTLHPTDFADALLAASQCKESVDICDPLTEVQLATKTKYSCLYFVNPYNVGSGADWTAVGLNSVATEASTPCPGGTLGNVSGTERIAGTASWYQCTGPGCPNPYIYPDDPSSNPMSRLLMLIQRRNTVYTCCPIP